MTFETATHYARRASAALAYQLRGEGVDTVLVGGSASLTRTFGDPAPAHWLQALASFSRLTIFDQRGAGLSDPLPAGGPLPLEERMADLVAVIDDAGLERPWLLATHDGGPVALMAATSYPERFSGLVLVNTAACLAAADDFTDGFSPADLEGLLDFLSNSWGTGRGALLWAPSMARTPGGVERFARLEQSACSPSQAVAQTRQAFATDARHLLALVAVPTLVVQARFDAAVPPNNGRYLADRIKHAELVELPRDDHMAYDPDIRAYVDAIRAFIIRVREPASNADRRLATVVFTDIVDSTGLAVRIGDSRWTEVLDAHDQIADDLARTRKGRVVKSLGDGLLLTFDGPAQAVEFAIEFNQQAQSLGIAVRCGIHTGEVQHRGEDVAGLSVHAASRIANLASGGDILVSRAVVDLVDGSGLRFETAGRHTLRGLEAEWALFKVGESGASEMSGV